MAEAIISSIHDVPSIESLSQLLSLPGAHFIRAAYVCTLGRDADNAGLYQYMSLLMRGSGKEEVLCDLMNSPEARNRSDPNMFKPKHTALAKELDQLRMNNSRHLFRKWSRLFGSQRKFNALEFRLENMICATLDRMEDRLKEELSQRIVVQGGAGQAHAVGKRIDTIQAQRRAISRPLGKN